MTYQYSRDRGAGYIGSTLVPRLLEAGHKVTVVDNFLFKQATLNNCCHYDNFLPVKGDIRTERTMLPLLKTADVIIPLAALSVPRSAIWIPLARKRPTMMPLR